MTYVYLVRNSRGRWYIGSTTDLQRRMREHISGKNFSTAYDKTWKLIYYETYSNGTAAREREKKLKSFGSTFGHLMKRLNIHYKKGRGKG